jgi:hypothetical protein
MCGARMHADGRSAAATASSVNNSLIAAAMVEAAGGPRPDIMTYVWLWPDAKPVSHEQLVASIAVPASLGGDGIIMWGSSSDAHVDGYAQTITQFLQSDAGPMIKRCAANVVQCRAALCNGHGRCSYYDAAAPDAGCRGPSPADAVTCLCDAGWHGKQCDHQQGSITRSV